MQGTVSRGEIGILNGFMKWLCLSRHILFIYLCAIYLVLSEILLGIVSDLPNSLFFFIAIRDKPSHTYTGCLQIKITLLI